MIQNILPLPPATSDWRDVWLSFAAYALVVTILFAILFKHKHDPAAGRVAHVKDMVSP